MYNFTRYYLVFLGLLLAHAHIRYEYVDNIYPLSLDSYENENLIRRLLMGEDGDDENEEDDSNDEDEDENYDNYENDENSDKRDLIKGPSYLPSIDDDIADSDLERENNDVQMGSKRTIERSPNTGLMEGKESFDIVNAGRQEVGSANGIFQEPILNNFQFKKARILSEEEKQRRKNLLSESLINLLYDWKKHKTPKTLETFASGDSGETTTQTFKQVPTQTPPTQTFSQTSAAQTPSKEDIESARIIKKLRKASHTLSDYVKPIASEEDVSQGIPENSSSQDSSTKSVLEEEKIDTTAKKSKEKLDTVNGKKSKEKFNVLVNVNINEPAARRSKVNYYNGSKTHNNSPYSGSSEDDEEHKTKSYVPKYGALQKLRGEADEEESGSGSTDTKELLTEERNNNSINLFAGFAFPKSNQVTIVTNGNGMSDADAEDDEEENEESGSTDTVDESSMTIKAESEKGSEEKSETAAGNTDKLPNDNVLKPSSKKVKKLYNPTHAYAETAEAEKGETPDTVFANKLAADRMEKDNELEHNDHTTESVTTVKDKQTKELSKEKEEVKTSEKIIGFSKTLDPEAMAHNVKSGHLKMPKAEDVSIEQVKDKNKKPKEIPKEAAIASKSPEQPLMKIASVDKEDEQNDELLFTKQERELEKNKGIMKESIKKKENTDDKYETLEEVREKFKNWEHHLENNKKIDHVESKPKDSDTKEAVSQTEKNGDKAPEKIHDEIKDKEKEKFSSDDLKSLNENNKDKEDTGKEVKDDKESSIKEKVKKTDTATPTGDKADETSSSKSDETSSSKADETGSWLEEEKVLLQKLKNPYIHKISEYKKNRDKDDDDYEAAGSKKKKQVEKEATDVDKSSDYKKDDEETYEADQAKKEKQIEKASGDVDKLAEPKKVEEGDEADDVNKETYVKKEMTDIDKKSESKKSEEEEDETDHTKKEKQVQKEGPDLDKTTDYKKGEEDEDESDHNKNLKEVQKEAPDLEKKSEYKKEEEEDEAYHDKKEKEVKKETPDLDKTSEYKKGEEEEDESDRNNKKVNQVKKESSDLDKTSEYKKQTSEEEADRDRKEKQIEKEAADLSKNANEEFSSVAKKVATDNEREEKEVTESSNKAFTASVDKNIKSQAEQAQELSTGNKDISKKDVKYIGEQQGSTTLGRKSKLTNQNIKQLQQFKDQILTEVAKIDNLQSEYGTDEHSTKDLSEAKDVLEKDLKVVKELESNLMKKASKSLKVAPKFTKTVSKSKQEYEKVTPKVKEPSDKDNEEEEVIPDAKLGFDAVPEKQEEKKKKKVKKFDPTYEYSYYASKKPVEKEKPIKKHPIEEIHSLLKAEIQRLRIKKGGRKDKQLSNIRKLVQNRLKALISSGELDKTTFHTLTPAIKELGKLLKNRIKNEKKVKQKKHRKKKKNNKSRKISNKEIELVKNVENERRPVEAFKSESKIHHIGNKMQSSGVDKQINKMQKEISKVKPAASPQQQNNNDNKPPMSPKDLQQATTHISNAQDVFSRIQNNNVSLEPSQSNKMKTLLTTLNQKLGEIYNKAQNVPPAHNAPPANQQYNQQRPQQTPPHNPQPNAQQNEQQIAPQNAQANGQQNTSSNYHQQQPPSDAIPNVYIPQSYIDNPSTPSYTDPSPQNLFNQPAQGNQFVYLNIYFF